jgi:flavin reductase (DIM6/NTAB) family NADH-FMN oxidoreductase RutF
MTTRTAIDPSGLDRRSLSALFTGMVIPRPVAWVSTIGTDGTLNLAPHSFFNVVSNKPPMVYFMTSFTREGGIKDTLRNVRATGEFVVNLVKWDHLRPMVLTGSPMPPEENEFVWANLATAPSITVAPPRVADTPVAIECKVAMILQIGSGNMVFGNVTHFSLAEGVLRPGFEGLTAFLPGCLDPAAIAPVSRLGGDQYAPLGDIVESTIPEWEDLKASGLGGGPRGASDR